ncbi:hypothetical protein Tco_0735397 [Tanacetum coccineum]
MMGTTMGTIRFAIHGDPDRYRTAIGIARTRSKIAKGLAIPVTMISTTCGTRRNDRSINADTCRRNKWVDTNNYSPMARVLAMAHHSMVRAKASRLWLTTPLNSGAIPNLVPNFIFLTFFSMAPPLPVLLLITYIYPVTPMPITPASPGLDAQAAGTATTQDQYSGTQKPVDEETTKTTKRALFLEEPTTKSKKKKD